MIGAIGFPIAASHGRDKIEFNLKSQKLEELTGFAADPVFCGTRTLGGFDTRSTEKSRNFEVFSGAAFRAFARWLPSVLKDHGR